MQLFGLTVTRTKHAPALSSPSSRGGWWPVVREVFTGAWQRNIELRTEDVLAYSAVYACVTLIASDISKLRIKLTERDANGIWNEIENSAYSPVLREPNQYQNWIKLLEQWVVSKLIHGNAYILKARDERGVVRAFHVLNAQRVRPLVAPDGSVFYALDGDDLAEIPGGIDAIPASEIIHDVMVPLYHPLCGVSPLSACGIPASQGLRIQRNSERFFANGSQPGGLLTAPGNISEEDRKIIQEKWDSEYSGDNTGKVAVLGNGLKYEAMSVNAVDAQLIEQLKWTAENVCTAFKVPAFKIGVAPAPVNSDVESLDLQYYSQCLQNPMECIESLLKKGLGLSTWLGIELDKDDLMKMNTPSKVKAAADAIGGGGMSPNEARKRFLGLGPVTGGEAPYLQQQNFSLSALARRDANADPFASVQRPQAAPDIALDDDDDSVSTATSTAKIMLQQQWVQMLSLLPESGMGFHLVDVSFVDGRNLYAALVFNASELQVPASFVGAVVEILIPSRKNKSVTLADIRAAITTKSSALFEGQAA